MSMTHQALALAVLAAFAASTSMSTAAAQDHVATVSRAQVSEARVHFERGVELYREGSFDAALVEFQRSHELAPNYKILYNLAQVQAERHEYVAAVQLLNEYLQKGGNEIAAERRQAVAQDMEKLSVRIATVSIDVSVEGAEVFVDDVSVGHAPLASPLPVNVGSRRIRAEKPGFLPQARTITVAGAERAQLVLTLQPAPVVAQQSAPERTVQVRNMTPFWISLGATVALGAATGVFGALALGANGDLDSALNTMDRQDIDSKRGKVRTMAALTDGFGAGTLLAAGATVWLLLSPPEHTERLPATGLRASVAPSLTGLHMSGSF